VLASIVTGVVLALVIVLAFTTDVVAARERGIVRRIERTGRSHGAHEAGHRTHRRAG
jgi:hypothetical protein